MSGHSHGTDATVLWVFGMQKHQDFREKRRSLGSRCLEEDGPVGKTLKSRA